MNKLGLKGPGFENRRTFSKKAREPQKLLRVQKFAFVNISESRTVKQAFKTVWKSSTLVKAIFTIKSFENRTKFSNFQRVQVEWRNYAFVKIRSYFKQVIDSTWANQGSLSRASLGKFIVSIVLGRRLLVNLCRISMQEGTSLVWRKTLISMQEGRGRQRKAVTGLNSDPYLLLPSGTWPSGWVPGFRTCGERRQCK